MCTEKASVDEGKFSSISVYRVCGVQVPLAFLDFTVPVQAEIIKRFPHLSQGPENSILGLDTPLPSPPQNIAWPLNTSVVPVHADLPTHDETSDTPDEPPATWHDLALSIAAEMMYVARQEIKNVLGYTTSAVSLTWSYHCHLS